MAKVRSKSKIVEFTAIVSTPANFDLQDHLTGVSIDLEDDDMNFEEKSLKCLEVKDNFIVLFGYTALGLEYCSKNIKARCRRRSRSSGGKRHQRPRWR